MAWAGSNSFAALTTQRDQPKPKKNLAQAKDASKVHVPEEPKAPKPVDPKAGTGNNSAKPNRPERPMDRKGRTFDKPKKSVPGTKDERTKRDGKDWGEGKMGKRAEDGEEEVLAEENAAVAAAPAAGAADATTPDAKSQGRRERGRGREGGRGRDAKPELTPEEQAALEAERAAEARQMTLEEYNAKKSGSEASIAADELKEARKVTKDAELQKLQEAKRADLSADDWASLAKKEKQAEKKSPAAGAAAAPKPKKEKIVFEAPRQAPKRREENDRPLRGGGGGGRGRDRNQGANQNRNGNAAAPAAAAGDMNLQDDSSFPKLGK